MKTTWAWHPYHEGPSPLMLFVGTIEARRAVILTTKPVWEHALRLRLFKAVVGPLPQALLDQQAESEAALSALAPAEAALVSQSPPYPAAWDKYNAIIKAHTPAILVLHAIECPDCPWDGNTIFPEARA